MQLGGLIEDPIEWSARIRRLIRNGCRCRVHVRLRRLLCQPRPETRDDPSHERTAEREPHICLPRVQRKPEPGRHDADNRRRTVLQLQSPAEHLRQFIRDAPSTLPEHRAEHVAAVSGKRTKRHLQRQHLLAIGPEALAYSTELTHRRPGVWLGDIDRLHDLLQTYGEPAMRAAFARGPAEQTLGAEYIAHDLDGGTALTLPLPFEPSAASAMGAPRGGRIRGGAERRAWTRPSPGRHSCADGGRS